MLTALLVAVSQISILNGWAFYSIASAEIVLASFFGSIDSALLAARFLRLGTLVGWMGASLIALKLMSASESEGYVLDRRPTHT